MNPIEQVLVSALQSALPINVGPFDIVLAGVKVASIEVVLGKPV